MEYGGRILVEVQGVTAMQVDSPDQGDQNGEQNENAREGRESPNHQMSATGRHRFDGPVINIYQEGGGGTRREVNL